eukprot:768109-Hanusia_phi.AAC.4
MVKWWGDFAGSGVDVHRVVAGGDVTMVQETMGVRREEEEGVWKREEGQTEGNRKDRLAVQERCESLPSKIS